MAVTKSKTKSNTAKPKAAAKPKKPSAKPSTQAKPNSFRYPGSAAERMDNALLAGGPSWEALAKQAGTTAGTIRSHGKYREKSGRYRLEEGDRVRLVHVEA